ncbi:MAG: glycoside hydrolase family 3 C-terminal domain-containing protein [Acidimicrobiales bacterium]|nr:glycoside hydrolase family 3 C-terminal domain-containing protein [Acidimicrobiales bacterium]
MAIAALVGSSQGVAPTVQSVHPSNPVIAALASAPRLSADCPWLARAMSRHEPPSALARLVLDRMTLEEKLGEIVLFSLGPYENVNLGVARLCIPPLTLQDGPQGLAYGDTGVTQLPAPLALAATFDTRLARSYGIVQATEAKGQGFDLVQGPTLDLLRIPQTGRAFETLGEDPLLAGTLGVAEIGGIQSQQIMAQAKEFAVYSQETDRGALNDVVSDRTLHELYLPAFQAAVARGQVASVMCAYPQLGGTYQCQDAALLGLLDQWGFGGFVRSDLGAVHDPAAALVAGTNLLKPGSISGLATSVANGLLPMGAVDDAVARVLTSMFAYGVVGRDPAGEPGDPVNSVDHAAVARTVAERAAVLLRNQGGILPLSVARDPSVAVIGADAQTDPVTTGFGSSHVQAPFVSSPLGAIRRRAGKSTRVAYASGGSRTGPLPPVPPTVLTPSSGRGTGLTLTLTRLNGAPSTVQLVQPTVDAFIRPYPGISSLLRPEGAEPPVEQRLPGGAEAADPPLLGSGGRPSLAGHRTVASSIGQRATRSEVVLPPGWNDVDATWTGTITPPASGAYTFSLQGSGSSSLVVDGTPVVSDMLSHVLGRWSGTISLTGGRPVPIQVTWDPFDKFGRQGSPSVVASSLTLGWHYVAPDLAQAVAAARKADVAVVFAGDYNAESFDRPSLELPGDQNQLISAVAAVNPRTVVVLNTGGPVLMPWIDNVAAVVEGWYAGEEDGNAMAAVLYGDVDPSGRLPVTFPTSAATSPISSPDQWPGVDLVSTYSEGLDVGYRYNQATGVAPLFPFGGGLSYTRFVLSDLTVHPSGAGAIVHLEVTNVGGRAGVAVPEVYVTQPAAAGEPPNQLAAFTTVPLGAGSSRRVTLTVAPRSFEAYLGGRWTSVPGSYTLSAGQSSASLPLHVSLAAPTG